MTANDQGKCHVTATTNRLEDGATAVEYGLLVAGIGLVLVLAGPWLHQLFLDVLDAVLDGML